MIKSNNVTTGAVVFVIFLALFTNMYIAFEDKYNITPDGTGCSTCTDTNLTIGDSLLNITTMKGIKDVQNSLNAFSVPGNVILQSFEVLTGAGLGIIKVFLGLAVLPGQITDAILRHYFLPQSVAKNIGLILNLYILFILLRHILKQE